MMSSTPALIVFDLDGTLLDSLVDIQFALNTALGEHGLEGYDIPSVRRMVGHGLSELAKKALGADPQRAALHGAVLARIKSLYLDVPYRETQPYPGIVELVAELKARGVVLTVLTNKAQAIAEIIVEHFFPKTFTLVRGEHPGMPRKPDPLALEGLLAALDELKLPGLPRGQAALKVSGIFVGDSEADVQTAVAAGMSCVAALWGFRSREELVAHGATTFAKDAGELRIELGL